MDTAGMSLKGQVAVVTGAGRGIGKAIALALAARGAALGLIARTDAELKETAREIAHGGGRAMAFVADVTDAETIHNAMARFGESLGAIDLLVNNAGMLQPIGPFWENDLNTWMRGISVNLGGAVICSHAVLPGMVARQRGRIINVASGAGLGMGLDYMSSYVTAKTAMLRFTESVASEAKQHGVFAFTLSPGPVRTAMGEYALNSPEAKKWLPWYGKFYEPGGVHYSAEAAAEFAVKLASGAADALTGRYFSVAYDLDGMIADAEWIEKEELYLLRLKKG
jgi:NAD(P)-dependent dehydrogenase (short-subunit alcohol dehydrogenase family)